MDQRLMRRHPPCPKCEGPMNWDSDQIVSGRGGDEVMEVYKCDRCDRLRAVAPLKVAA